MMDKYADKILYGGSFFSGITEMENVDFIAIKKDTIIAIGEKEYMHEYMGKNTKVFEFNKDNLILPGLHDNHIHLIQAGMLVKFLNLFNTKSSEDVAKATAAYAKQNPDLDWIIGFGWYKFSWPKGDIPNKKILDSLIPDLPVILFDAELHSVWVNSKALEVANINSTTPDIESGEIVRDEFGEPTGHLYETALTLVAKYALDFNDDIVEDMINKYTDYALSHGITSVSDMTPYLNLDMSYENVFVKMAKSEKLKIRINAARDLFEGPEKTISFKSYHNDKKSMYRTAYYKQFMDGVIGSYTAMLFEEYLDRPGFLGEPIIDIDKLNEAVLNAHNAGIPVRLHACGDKSLNIALNAYENAIKLNPLQKCRHQIEHIELISPDDINRMASLGIIGSIQPEHIISGINTFSDNTYPEQLGEERCKYTWPFKSLLNAGVTLACGSDAPVVEGNPFVGIHAGIKREHPDGTPFGGWNPQEKLSPEELLSGYTNGASYAEGKEDILGTLEVGKLADITVFDRNILKVSTDDILNTKVIMTLVNGKIMYSQ